jgi:hypothetical protein
MYIMLKRFTNSNSPKLIIRLCSLSSIYKVNLKKKCQANISTFYSDLTETIRLNLQDGFAVSRVFTLIKQP